MGLFDIFKAKIKAEESPRPKEIAVDFRNKFNSPKATEIEIASINLPSGKIIAADPFYTFEQKPFTRTVAPGKYPVSLLMAEIGTDHHRVAFSKIKFKVDKAIRWIMAIPEDTAADEINSLQEDEFIGYAVDAGLGCFVDEETNQFFLQAMDGLVEKNPDANYYDDVLAAEFMKYSGSHRLSRALGDWNNHLPTKEEGKNIVLFASGWGDGCYPSYWGLNEQGDMVELVTDFLVEFE